MCISPTKLESCISKTFNFFNLVKLDGNFVGGSMLFENKYKVLRLDKLPISSGIVPLKGH
ncbi:hypothetical protein Lalb_Chr24g0397271 [Lupinus albus]|uniref:Uncharacterized protein n=1 Tax=Lupinus albus TaxID=3870 RepID=A0A6A4NFB6_LUPAL|nr:hypothetical protein Lalb_Chr24g0397271 [Lupinus albus]